MATKRDFEQTARIIRFEVDNAAHMKVEESKVALSVLGATARHFAGCYSQDNPRFDREGFLKACGF